MKDVLSHIRKIQLLSKRQKIILSSVLLSFGLLATQLVPIYLIQRFIIILTIFAYFLSLWVLLEGINKLKAFILMVLPTLFTLAVASYYFLLPVRWLTRLPVAFLFGLSFYTLLLSQNVFNVASIRTIPLYRAASTSVFLFTLITAYLLFNVIASFEMNFAWNGVVVFILSFFLILQIIWSLNMEGIDSLTFTTSLFIALILGELALVISFWPITAAMFSLVLSTALYVCLGIMTHALRSRLTKGGVLEYVVIGALVYIVALLTTSWNG